MGRQRGFVRWADASHGAHEIFAHTVPHLGYSGLLADGEFGLMQSSTSDLTGLDVYGRTGTYGRRLTAFFGQFFSGDEGVYLDIGANIGLTIVPVSLGNPKVRCLGFEPEPVNFHNLTTNVARNATLGNVDLVQKALFDRVSTLQFGLSDRGNVGDHRVILKRDPGRRQVIEVPAAPLDHLVGLVATKLAAKLDVQGAEPFVISGGQKTLSRAGAVVIEFSPYLIDQLGGSVEVILDFLAGFDRIALLPAESNDELVFAPAKDACTRLRTFYTQARADEKQYMDAYAERRVA